MHIGLTRLGTESGAADLIRSAHATDPRGRSAHDPRTIQRMIRRFFATQARQKNFRDVEISALSNFQPSTTLGAPKNVKKLKNENFQIFLVLGS